MPPLTIHETVKAAVTVRQAAERCGLQVGRNGMTCRAFRKDSTSTAKAPIRSHGCRKRNRR